MDAYRRKLCRLIACFIGLPTILDMVGPVERNIDPESKKKVPVPPETAEAMQVQIGAKPFLAESKIIVSAFHAAPTGTLMMYYQLFWQIFIASDNEIVHRITALEELCSAALRNNPKARPHRFRVLPAVAAIHGLNNTSDADTADFLRSLICRIHQEALEENPNREVVEIIWQNMTAALIEDRDGSWQTFIAGQLIREAEKVCHKFLEAKEAVLFTAAVAAWQFLLTYERAMESRIEVSEDLVALKSAMQRIRVRKSPRLPWLLELEKIYQQEGRRTFDQMLPHTWEIVIGRLNPLTSFGAAAEYFTVLRLVMNFVNYANDPSLFQTPERAKELVTSALTFLSTYDFSKEEWLKLRSSTMANLLPKEAFGYFDNQVFGKGGLWEQKSEFESRNDPKLSALVPFRNFHEANVAAKAHPALHDHPEEFAGDIARGAYEKLWDGTIAYTTGQGLRASAASRRIADEAVAILKDNKTVHQSREFIIEETAPFIGNTTVSVGFSPADSVGAGSLPESEDRMSVDNRKHNDRQAKETRSGTTSMLVYEYNDPPLGGRVLEEIKQALGLNDLRFLEALGRYDPKIDGYPIWVSGPHEAVESFLDLYMGTIENDPN